MAITFNPFTSNFDYIGASSADPYFIDPVATESLLPSPSPDGAICVVQSTGQIYEYKLSLAQWVNRTQVFFDSVGVTPSATAEIQTTPTNGNNVVENHIALQPADNSHPGLISTTFQTIGGIKTFTSNVLTPGVDATTAGGTLGIGITNAATINIGWSGAVVNIQGTTNTIDVTNFNVANKNMNLNTSGPAGSGSGVGIEVEENSIVTGYINTSSDRNSWKMLAPNTAGIITFTPGASGFTINQGSHNPLSLSTPGIGLFLDAPNQILSSQYATTAQPGLLSSTDWTTFNNKVGGSGTSGYVAYFSAPGTLTSEQYLSAVRGGLATDASAFTGVVKASAGAFSASQIVNADVANAAAIAYSKLNLSNSIVNADVAAGAAIAYSKLSLTGSIVNADIAGGAAIVLSKLAALTANRALQSDGSGVVSASAVTATELGYVSGVTSPIQTQLNNLYIPGDIEITVFNGANNQSASADVIGLSFNGAVTRTFEAQVGVMVTATTSNAEKFVLEGSYDGTIWNLSYSSSGDSSGVAFSITNSGQVQYMSTSNAGFVSLVMKFRAITTPV